MAAAIHSASSERRSARQRTVEQHGPLLRELLTLDEKLVEVGCGRVDPLDLLFFPPPGAARADSCSACGAAQSVMGGRVTALPGR